MWFASIVRGLTGQKQLLAAVLSGLFLGLAQAPWSFIPVVIFAIPVLFWLHSGAISRRRAALIGWLAGVGYFGLTLSWIVEPFLVDVGRDGWMAPFALFFMAAGLALFWAASFALANRGNAVMFVVFWTLAELLRSTIFTGFPWGLIAYGWIETPVMQMVSIVGVHGLGLLTLTGAVLLAKGRGVLAVLVFASMWGFGTYRLAQPVLERETAFTVRIVQPNAAQELKWLPEFAQVFYDRQIELTSAPADIPPDLVIWPEAAIPFIPARRADLMQQIGIAAKGADVLLGARRIDDNGNWFNSMAMINPDGRIVQHYDKHHLVPFGEYIPFGALLSKTGIQALTRESFDAGPQPITIAQDGIPPFVPLICYEAIFPAYAAPSGQRPEWIVHITNDAWFGRFNGPYQHLAQARSRTIEQGLPLVRSANTGVSAMIDPFGRILNSLPLGQLGFVDAALPAALPQTIYGRFGNWPVIFLLLILTFSQYFISKRRRS